MKKGDLFTFKFDDVGAPVVCEVIEDKISKIAQTDVLGDKIYLTFKIIYSATTLNDIYSIRRSSDDRIIRRFGKISLTELIRDYPEELV